jgi:hypothetical protein
MNKIVPLGDKIKKMNANPKNEAKKNKQNEYLVNASQTEKILNPHLVEIIIIITVQLVRLASLTLPIYL